MAESTPDASRVLGFSNNFITTPFTRKHYIFKVYNLTIRYVYIVKSSQQLTYTTIKVLGRGTHNKLYDPLGTNACDADPVCEWHLNMPACEMFLRNVLPVHMDHRSYHFLL